MLKHDTNNCANYFSCNLQNHREKNKDVCEKPLFYNIQTKLWEVETIKRLVALHDNYEPNAAIPELVTHTEIQEEEDCSVFHLHVQYGAREHRLHASRRMFVTPSS